MVQLTVRKIGNSLGLILPQEALQQLNVSEGDQLFFTAAPDGGRLTHADPEFERQIEAARDGMKRYFDTLRKLAE